LTLPYVSGLLARYPDLTELGPDEIDDSPWADGPMSGNARGPLLHQHGHKRSGIRLLRAEERRL